jgi:hypothetical protein
MDAKTLNSLPLNQAALPRLKAMQLPYPIRMDQAFLFQMAQFGMSDPSNPEEPANEMDPRRFPLGLFQMQSPERQAVAIRSLESDLTPELVTTMPMPALADLIAHHLSKG